MITGVLSTACGQRAAVIMHVREAPTSLYAVIRHFV